VSFSRWDDQQTHARFLRAAPWLRVIFLIEVENA
jgi:hypothetical protein